MCVITNSTIPQPSRKELAKMKAIIKELLTLDYVQTQKDDWFVHMTKKVTPELDMQFSVNLQSNTYSVSVYVLKGGMISDQVYSKFYTLGPLKTVLEYIENHELSIIWDFHTEIQEREEVAQILGNEKRRLEQKKSQCSK